MRFEPDVYGEEEPCIVGGHPCVYSEACGFEEKRSPLTKPTAEEMAAYQSEARRERILYILKDISQNMSRLTELLTEEFKIP